MTETNEKIHVLADETLGGIKREYVEVDRKAEVGEKIVIVDKMYPDDIYKKGDIFTVDRDFYSEYSFVESDGVVSDTNSSGIVYHVEYHVLEPTDIVHIDGGRYELTDRKAEVGEKVIIVALDPGLSVESDLGKVTTVTELCSEDDVDTDKIGWVKRSEYRVLVPVEAEADEPQPSDLIDVVSNLATRVADLERTIKRQKDEIDTLHKDNRTLGEELEKAQKDLRETMDDVSCMDEEIKRAGSDINEMSFAVEDLAEALKKNDPVYGEHIFTAEEVVALMTALKVRP